VVEHRPSKTKTANPQSESESSKRILDRASEHFTFPPLCLSYGQYLDIRDFRSVTTIPGLAVPGSSQTIGFGCVLPQGLSPCDGPHAGDLWLETGQSQDLVILASTGL